MNRSDRTQRRFDVVLFGATGFTGRLVAEYLAAHGPRDLKWAIAGRSRAKLEGVRRDLAGLDPRLAEMEILVGDSHDAASLAAIAEVTRVVCTTVGPYMKYGAELAAACAEHGTDYCDLTGEAPFVRASIDRNHARAEANHARIVHCAGFDSIPSDLGVWILHEHLREKHGRRLARATLYVGRTKGGFSGGTVASILSLMEAGSRDPQIRRQMTDPDVLLPEAERGHGPRRRDKLRVHFDHEVDQWTAPFLMAGINTRVVRRTNALLDFAYGRGFEYEEVMSVGRGPGGLARATAIASALGAFVGVAASSAGRSVLERFVPAPGEGPSKADRDAGFFQIRVLGESDEGPGGATRRVEARVEGTSDPGYGETAKMLGEVSICLAKDEARLPNRFGVLTPASAMGAALLDRLRAAGMTFDVSDRS